MSDSTNSSYGFLSNWKFSLAVCVPCFAVSLGAIYYFYSKPNNKNRRPHKPTENHEDKPTPSEQVKDLKKQGKAEFRKQNYDAAITFYTQALSMCPLSEKELLSTVYQNRAAAYSSLNNYEKCVADCNKALALEPSYKKALSRRARALTKLGNFKLALEDITAVVTLDEVGNQSNIMFKESVIKRLGKQNLNEYLKHNAFKYPSKKIIENYLTQFSEDPFNDEFPQTLMKSEVNTGLELALKCFKDKNYEQIEDACKEELNKTHNSLIRQTYALNMLATFSIIRGNYATGIELLTSVIKSSRAPTKLVINSLIKRSSVYHQQEQVEKSFEDLKRAENIDPNYSDVFFHRAQIYLSVMNREKAVEEFKRAMELNPKFILSNVQCFFAQYLHAKYTSNELDAEHFLNKLKEIIIKYPDYGKSYALYAQALLQKKAYEEADLILKKAYEMFPENASLLVHRALVVLSWRSSISEASNFFQQAIKVDPECCYFYELLGILYTETAVELNPKFILSNVQCCYAQYLHAKHTSNELYTENFLNKLKEIIIKYPDYGESYTTYMHRGQLEEAVECFEKAVPLSKSEKELLYIFSLRDAARAQLVVDTRLGLTPQL